MKSGAGGNWRRFDEKFDASIIKQTTGVSCMSAVGEMLLKARGISVPQRVIRDTIGEPSYIAILARTLNRFDTSTDGKIWRGFATDEDSLEIFIRNKSLAAILIEPFSRIGHAVVICGKARSGLIKINDPFDQTSYKMTMEDFLRHWGGEVVTRWYPERK